jgi:hypothetical protein
VLEDDNNEFITGLEPNANQSQEDQGCVETSAKAQEGASASQAKAKRKRPVRHRKKLRTMGSLMKPQSVASTSDSEGNQDAMVSTENQDVCLSICHYLVNMQCNVCQLYMNFELMCVGVCDVSCIMYEL